MENGHQQSAQNISDGQTREQRARARAEQLELAHQLLNDPAWERAEAWIDRMLEGDLEGDAEQGRVSANTREPMAQQFLITHFLQEIHDHTLVCLRRLRNRGRITSVQLRDWGDLGGYEVLSEEGFIDSELSEDENEDVPRGLELGTTPEDAGDGDDDGISDLESLDLDLDDPDNCPFESNHEKCHLNIALMAGDCLHELQRTLDDLERRDRCPLFGPHGRCEVGRCIDIMRALCCIQRKVLNILDHEEDDCAHIHGKGDCPHAHDRSSVRPTRVERQIIELLMHSWFENDFLNLHDEDSVGGVLMAEVVFDEDLEAPMRA